MTPVRWVAGVRLGRGAFLEAGLGSEALLVRWVVWLGLERGTARGSGLETGVGVRRKVKKEQI